MASKSGSKSPKRYKTSCNSDKTQSDIELSPDASLEEKKKILDGKTKRELKDAYIALHSNKLDIEMDLVEKSKLILDLTDEAQKQIQVTNNLKEHNSELKLKLQQAQGFVVEKEKVEEEKRTINEELAKERQEHWKFVHQFAQTIEKLQNKVHITGSKNIQIGDSNIVKDEVMSHGQKSNIIKDEVMSQGQELIRKLSLSIDKHITKRQELEMEIRNNKAMLKEMQDTIKKIVSNIKNKSKILREDKELLIVLTKDLSDKRVINDGVEQLRNTKLESQELPAAVHAMVERLLNKFGSITCDEFIQILEGKDYNPNKEIAPDKTDQIEGSQLSVKTGSNSLQEFDNDASLNRSLCVAIISKWLHISEGNDSETLLAKMEADETKLSAELIRQFQDEINSVDVSNDTKEMQQQAGLRNKEQSLHGLPDAISQFMHQLEGLKIVIDIERKVDILLKSVAELTCKDHNSRLNRSSVSSDV